MNNNGIAEIAELTTPNIDHLKKLWQYDNKRNLLFQSAMANNPELVQYFHNKNLDINSVDSAGNNAAMATKNEKIALYLLENGSDYTIRNKSGETLLEIAVKNGFSKVVEILIAKEDVLINGKNENRSPLILAAQNGHEDIVSLLLENGADVQVKDNDGNTPVLWAVRNINLEMAIILKRFGACMDCKNKRGETPIQNLKNIIDEYYYQQEIAELYETYGEFYSENIYKDIDINTAEALYNLLEGTLYY